MKNKAILITGNVPKTLIKLTIPMFWGLFAVISFNVVDTYFISRLGTDSLAAMGFIFPVVMFINMISLGLAVGTSSVISRAIGENKKYFVQRLATDSLSLSLILVFFFVIIGISTIHPLFRLMGASSELMPLIDDYMRIWYIGVIFVIIPMVGNGAIRGTGDTKLPAIIMGIAAATNVILDPIFIFGLGPIPAMGLKGAAFATVLGRTTTLFAAFYVLHKKHNLITFKKPSLEEILFSWKNILRIGVPTALTNIILPASKAIITTMIAIYGNEAVAAYGLVTRVEAFLLIPLMALSTSMGPFSGQNWGANNVSRIKSALKFSAISCIVYSLISAIIVGIFSTNIVHLFDTNELVVFYGTLYLLMIPITYMFDSFGYVSSSTLNAIGKPIYPTILTIVKMFIIYIPLAVLLSKFWGIHGIFLSNIIANISFGLGGILILRRALVKKEVFNDN